MTKVITRAKSLGQRLRNRLFGYLPSRRANVAAIVALTLVPLSGIMGLAAEASNWFLSQRAQQNAADTAVVAAANQALQDYYQACQSTCSWSSTNYVNEGRAVATKYGYTNAGNVTVSVVNTVGCPQSVSGAGLDCFQVTITKPIPLALSHLVGFNGNNSHLGAGLEWISASAVAGPVAEPSDVCLLTKGQGSSYGVSGTSFRFTGSHGINLGGCPVGSDDNMRCSGGNLQAPWGIAGNGDSDSNCGEVTLSQTGPITDPYLALAGSIPPNSCGSTSNLSTTSSLITDATAGSASTPKVYISCGTLQLSGNVAVSGVQTWVIVNGTVDLNGSTLSTSNSGGLTLIFTSPTLALAQAAVSSGGNLGYVTDSSGHTTGMLNISAPPANASNPFGGVTIYQDPTEWGTGSSASTYSMTWDGNGNTLGWDLSGGVYLPNADFTFNGAVDKAGNGYECFDMVVNDIVSHGGNQFSVFAPSMSNPLAQCGLEGTKTPYAAGYRYALVQ